MSDLELTRQAPGRGKTRVEFDYYPTPDWQTQELMRVLKPALRLFTGYGHSRALEPCVGEGHIVNAFSRADWLPFLNWTTNDLDPRHKASHHEDASREDALIWERDTWDYVITNPPFDQASSILARALPRTKVLVAMLLRISFLEPTEEREQLLANNPPDKLVVMKRWSYRANGSTDSVTSAWFIWARHHSVYLPGPAIETVPKAGSQQGGFEIGDSI